MRNDCRSSKPRNRCRNIKLCKLRKRIHSCGLEIPMWSYAKKKNSNKFWAGKYLPPKSLSTTRKPSCWYRPMSGEFQNKCVLNNPDLECQWCTTFASFINQVHEDHMSIFFYFWKALLVWLQTGESWAKAKSTRKTHCQISKHLSVSTCHELTMSSSPTQSSCHYPPCFNLSLACGLIIDIHGYKQLSEPWFPW